MSPITFSHSGGPTSKLIAKGNVQQVQFFPYNTAQSLAPVLELLFLIFVNCVLRQMAPQAQNNCSNKQAMLRDVILQYCLFLGTNLRKWLRSFTLAFKSTGNM